MSVKTADSSALSIVDQYYKDYGIRARELKEADRRFIGYLCAYVPLEVIHAAGFIPFRIKGNVDEPITMADTHMEAIVCPLVRSCYDMTLKGKYDFIEGLVIPHACDSICRTYEIWKYTLGLKYNHLVNVPHETGDSSVRFFVNILNTFRQSLGRFCGKDITDQNLNKSIEIYNKMRSNVMALYDLRKKDPPPISGAEATRTLIAGAGIPVEEFDDLLSGVIDEAKARDEAGSEKVPRVMVIGGQVDNANFIDLVEDCGAVVVAD
ncbi:MAG: 2-hydroxyacyl-CoA dehydratase family protein, partial [Thermodesulfobacteriota bacterium]|nr:2-hydroxyacyl-CoA dehydratase family protein [Thermodesulfobacteriota bacterium]